MINSIDIRKSRFFLFALTISIALASRGQPLIHDNDTAVNVIVTVFSILAGFLVAIIAISGDPAFMAKGSWRVAEIQRQIIQKRLAQQKLLFTAYLATLCLIFVSLLVGKVNATAASAIEYAYLFLSSMAFIYSLKLPGFLMRVQQDRIDAEIEARRRKAIPNQPKH